MKKPRTRKDLEADPRVEELWFEPENGWCIQLAVGYAFEWNHQFQVEATIREACGAMATVVEMQVVDGQNIYSRSACPQPRKEEHATD
tara:strand:- start:680 stop:943 length:264 start_codon:yes stop_codon:yes gene_type:complete